MTLEELLAVLDKEQRERVNRRADELILAELERQEKQLKEQA